jgi:hypothetical protein
MSQATNAKCKATDPLVTATAYLDPQNLAKFSSKELTYFPVEEIQPVDIQSSTYLLV